jgi:hypothetical protein
MTFCHPIVSAPRPWSRGSTAPSATPSTTGSTTAPGPTVRRWKNSVLLENAGDLICLKPHGIQVVWNDNDHVMVSLHTYGRHINYTGRSSFNLVTNEVKHFVVDAK